MADTTDIELMQHLDGELPEGAEPAVSERLAANTDDRTKVESLRQVGEAVRMYTELAADDVDGRFEGMWAQIERRIHANGEAPAAARSADAERAAERKRPGILQRIGEWLREQRAHFATGAVAAAAAAVLVLVLRPERERIVVRTEPPVAPPTAVASSEPPVVEDLEVYDGSGTVFTFPAEAGETATAVIWVERELPDDAGGPI